MYLTDMCLGEEFFLHNLIKCKKSWKCAKKKKFPLNFKDHVKEDAATCAFLLQNDEDGCLPLSKKVIAENIEPF